MPTAIAMGTLCSRGLTGRRGIEDFIAAEGDDEQLDMLAGAVYQNRMVMREYRT